MNSIGFGCTISLHEPRNLFCFFIVDLRINETRQNGAVENRTYQVRGESVYLFFEFTINQFSSPKLLWWTLELMRHSKPARCGYVSRKIE